MTTRPGRPIGTGAQRGAILLAISLALSAVACTSQGNGLAGALGDAADAVTGHCDENGNAVVVIANTPSDFSPQLTQERIDALARIVDEEAESCSSISVAIDTTGGQPVPVALPNGGDLRPPGADDSGRSVFRPVVVDAVVDAVAPAIATPPSEGSGSAPLTDLAWAVEQTDEGDSIYVLTDALASTPIDLNTPGLLDDPALAEQFVAAFPDITGRRVVFIGVGRTVDTVPTPQIVVERLQELYTQACKASGVVDGDCMFFATYPGSSGAAAQVAVAADEVRAEFPEVPLPTGGSGVVGSALPPRSTGNRRRRQGRGDGGDEKTEEPVDERYTPMANGWEAQELRAAAGHRCTPEQALCDVGAVESMADKDNHLVAAAMLESLRIEPIAKRLARAVVEAQALTAAQIRAAVTNVSAYYTSLATTGRQVRHISNKVFWSLVGLVGVIDVFAASSAIRQGDPLMSLPEGVFLMAGAATGQVFGAKLVADVKAFRSHQDRSQLPGDDILRRYDPSLCKPKRVDAMLFIETVIVLGVLWGAWELGQARGGGLLFAVQFLTTLGAMALALLHANPVADVDDEARRSAKAANKDMNRLARRARRLRKVQALLADAGKTVESSRQSRSARAIFASAVGRVRQGASEGSGSVPSLNNGTSNNGRASTVDVLLVRDAHLRPEGAGGANREATGSPLPFRVATDGTDLIDMDGVQALVALIRDVIPLVDGSRTKAVVDAEEAAHRHWRHRLGLDEDTSCEAK